MKSLGVNKYGLSRNIPSSVKREVRKKSGYGCVICGLGIYTYEHVDPLFSEAKSHDPNKIVLLCGGCHNRITKGIWSKDKVRLTMNNPFSLSKGYTRDYFDISEPFGVNIGRIYFYENETGELLRINGDTLLSIKIDEEGSPKLSGKFCSSSGKLLFEIVDNEWQGSLESWDIEAVGKRLIIKEEKRKILLQILANPPHIISIEKINLFYEGYTISTDESTGRITIGSTRGLHIDVSSGVAVTKGPLILDQRGITFDGGSFIALGQEPMNPLDFEKLLLTGQTVSVPSK